MKKVSLSLFILLVTFFVSAQQNNLVDVVYLKNGSIIKGIITEQVPNQSIKMQTADGNIFVYQTNEIEKISKETPTRQSKNHILGVRNSRERRGYIGLSVGPSIPVGDWSVLPTGLALNLVDFGYLFTDNFGVAGKWFGTAYRKSGVDFSAGGLLGGLLASTPITPKINLEGNILIGATSFRAALGGISGNSDLYFGYGIGAGLRYNTSEKISLLLNADYLGSDEYSSVNLTFGVAYRLK